MFDTRCKKLLMHNCSMKKAEDCQEVSVDSFQTIFAPLRNLNGTAGNVWPSKIGCILSSCRSSLGSLV